MKTKTAYAGRLLRFRPTILLPIVFSALFVLLNGAQAQNIQPLQDRFYLGIGTHQGIGGASSPRGYVPEINVGQIKELGFTSFRDDFSWSDFELPGHRLGFAEPLSRLKAQITSGVATPMLIFGSGHYLVPHSDPPTTAEARQRFIDYAVAAAKSVADRHPLFELWNEWNISARKNAEFNADNYLALAKATYPAVKQVLPNAPFVVGAIGDDPGWKWTASILQSGLLKVSDGISIHLYNHCATPAKRTAAEVIDRLTTFHGLVSRAGGNDDFPVYLTETGWPTATSKCGVSEQTQADNIAQLVLWASTAPPWLKGIWLYELKDSGTDRSDIEDNFGLYHFDNSPKAAACAVRDSWAFVRSSRGAQMVEPADGVVEIKVSGESGARSAVWSQDSAKRYQVRLKGDASGIQLRYVCDRSPISATGAWITLSSTPLLIAADLAKSPELEIRPAQ